MIFSLFGVEFKISVPFCVMLAFLLIVDRTGLMSASIFAVLVHEIGHILVMLKLKCLPREVNFCFSGILICGTSYCTHKENILIAVSGPVANFFMCLLFCLFGFLTHFELFTVFGIVQLVEGLINLCPVKGLDGGSILFGILNLCNLRHMELYFKLISVFSSIAILVIGVTVAVKNASNPSLLLLGIYLIILNIVKYDKDV